MQNARAPSLIIREQQTFDHRVLAERTACDVAAAAAIVDDQLLDVGIRLSGVRGALARKGRSPERSFWP